MRKATIVIGAFLLWLTAGPAGAVLVKPDGTGDYVTIQDAVNAAIGGTIIYLSDGTFTGTGNRDVDYLGKAITIKSQSGNPNLCVIDCQGTAASNHRAFIFQTGEGFDSILEGVTIANGYWFDRAGAIFCGLPYTGTNCHPTIRNCEFINNQAGAGGAISLLDSSPDITGCTFCGNHCDQFGGGAIWCDTGSSFIGSNPTITSCTFVGNQGPDGGAVWVVGSSPTIDRCLVAFNAGGAGITCAYYPSSLVLTCCDVYGNTGGDWIGCIASQLGTAGNLSEDPLFCDPMCRVGGVDYTISMISPCAASANPLCGLIGAWPEACGSTPTVGVSWGALKSAFR